MDQPDSASSTAPARHAVLVTSADHLARAGITALLGTEPTCSHLESVPPGNVLDLLDTGTFDVLIWDTGWDTIASLDDLAEAVATGTPVLALISADTSTDLPPDPPVDALRRIGVLGILPRSATPEHLVAALTAVAAGLVVLTPSLLPTVNEGAATPEPRDIPNLTQREREVILLLADGLANKTIASRLGLSEHTVKFHVNSLMEKLGAQSRTEVVAIGFRHGLVSL